MQSHCHHSPFPSKKSLSKLSWNIMERLPKSLSPMPLSTDVARWVVKGDNIEITSTCFHMGRILTWLDKTHAFTVWEGFEAKGCMSCPHNFWDRPCSSGIWGYGNRGLGIKGLGIRDWGLWYYLLGIKGLGLKGSRMMHWGLWDQRSRAYPLGVDGF